MSKSIHPADLSFYSALVAAGSLGAAAREMGLTTAAVSKRLAQIESRLRLTLVNRTTRRMSLTPEGEIYLDRARKILSELEDMEHELSGATSTPRGLVRVNATLGFGRAHIAPILADFSKANSQVQIQLQLSADPAPVSDDSWDVCFRFGAPPDSRCIAKFLIPNRRILVASPTYLTAKGEPKSPAELVRHNCIGIRQGSEAYGVWRFVPEKTKNQAPQSVKIRGNLTTNDGEIAVSWALDGMGILMRAEWDVKRHLGSGRLREVLKGYLTPNADVYAVYPDRYKNSLRIKSLVDFVQTRLKDKFKLNQA